MPAVEIEAAPMVLQFYPAASRSLVLFLSTFIMVQPVVGAMTPSSAASYSGFSTSSGAACVAKSDACSADPECSECQSAISSAVDCIHDFAVSLSTDDSCAIWSSYPCCLDATSNNDCLGNDAFTEYWLCSNSVYSWAAGEGECTAFTCDGLNLDGGGDDDSVMTVATPAPTFVDADSSHTAVSSDDLPSSVACGAEFNACLEDEVCVDCVTAIADEGPQDQFNKCIETLPSTGDICEILSAAPCCTDEASPRDCLGNEPFVAYYVCIINEGASGVGERCTSLACDGLGGGDNDSSATAFTPAPTTPIGAESSSTGRAGAGTTPAPSAAALSNESTSARGLDVTPSPTTEGGEESRPAPSPSTPSITSDDFFSSNYMCQDLVERCMEDEDCLMCIGAHHDFDFDLYNGCLEVLSVEVNTCEWVSGLVCCTEYAASEIECSANEIATELWLCSAETYDCSTEELVPMSCGGDGSEGVEVFEGVDGNGTVGVGTPSSGGVVALTILLSLALALL